jgi:hypothetical protein
VQVGYSWVSIRCMSIEGGQFWGSLRVHVHAAWTAPGSYASACPYRLDTSGVLYECMSVQIG